MIASLRGSVLTSDEKKVIVETGGVGFLVNISARDAVNMPASGEEVFLYTYMSVREDEISLFGFLDEDDLEVYKMLLGVSGIGPRAGLGILSALSADDLRMAVIAEDEKTIAKSPGIGAKTARKLILELKDKIDTGSFAQKLLKKGEAGADPAFEANRKEAVDVLVALGFSRSEAMRAVRSAELTPEMNTDQIITAALKERR